MAAAHRRLDHAVSFVELAAGGHLQDDMAGVPGNRGTGELPSDFLRANQMSLDGFTDEISQFLLIHQSRGPPAPLRSLRSRGPYAPRRFAPYFAGPAQSSVHQ